MITRKEILIKAVNDCLIEMYKWAQPSINLQDYLDNNKIIESGNDPFYKRYYLSENNFKYIKNRIAEAYGIVDHWNNDIDLLINYIIDPDSKKIVYNDKKEYVNITPLFDLTKDANEVLNLIKDCKNFYKLNKEYNDFMFSVTLGPSPTSNASTVLEYWHTHGRPDFKIKDFNVDCILYDENINQFINTLK